MLEKGSTNTVQLKYIKHYKNESLIVVSDITDKGMSIRTWFDAEKSKIDKDWRTGILIKKASKY